MEIFDRTSTDLLKTEDRMPARFAGCMYREVIQVDVMGDQLVMLANLRSQTFRGPVLVYLDDSLQIQARA